MSQKLPPKGDDYWKQIGHKGGEENKRLIEARGGNVTDHFSGIGTTGGNSTKARYGSEYYRKIGELGRLARGTKKE